MLKTLRYNVLFNLFNIVFNNQFKHTKILPNFVILITIIRKVTEKRVIYNTHCSIYGKNNKTNPAELIRRGSDIFRNLHCVYKPDRDSSRPTTVIPQVPGTPGSCKTCLRRPILSRHPALLSLPAGTHIPASERNSALR